MIQKQSVYIFLPVTRRVKGYTRFVEKYLKGRKKLFRYIYSWSGSLAESIEPCLYESCDL